MTFYQKILLLFIAISLYSCGKNDKNEEKNLKVNIEKPIPQENTLGVDKKQKKSTFKTPEDSIIAVKESILRKQTYKKKKVEFKTTETSTSTITQKSVANTIVIPSFVYIKKILKECEIGVPMSQKDLEAKYDIPEEAIGLVKSLTKISENEVDIKWKSTWLIEKVSDAKFNDGRMKMHFENNKMYTSGQAIAIKYNRKTYSDLILIGRNAYIPSVKGYHWQIGKD